MITRPELHAAGLFWGGKLFWGQTHATEMLTQIGPKAGLG